MRISVIIPALNEEEAIGKVIGDLPSEIVTEVLVVDGGSADRTRELADSLGARVLLETRRGYGRACLTGLENVSDPEIVVFLDGDYSDRPAELSRLIAPLRAGEADIAIGSRLKGGHAPGALGWHQILGNRVIAWVIGRLYGVWLSDMGPFRAMHYSCLARLHLEEMGYGWPVEMIIKGKTAGLRIVEVPVSYHPRIGKSKITGTLRGTCLATLHILRRTVRHLPAYWRARRRAK
jgi:glycosyltransferase involved in cell wall biosynthesis